MNLFMCNSQKDMSGAKFCTGGNEPFAKTLRADLNGIPNYFNIPLMPTVTTSTMFTDKNWIARSGNMLTMIMKSIPSDTLVTTKSSVNDNIIYFHSIYENFKNIFELELVNNAEIKNINDDKNKNVNIADILLHKRINKNINTKNIKKSPNSAYFRNVIEEICPKRKLIKTRKTEKQCNYTIIPIENSFINYEIRFSNAKKLSKHKSMTTNYKLLSNDMVLDNEQLLSDLDHLKSRSKRRTVSECESEDSFIVFDDANVSDGDKEMKLMPDSDSEDDSFIVFNESEDCNSEFDSDDSSDDDNEEEIEEDDESERDEPDFVRNTFSYQNLPSDKKVRFKSESELCTVYPMIKWSYAYQNARKGRWEEAVRDRDRFQARIDQVNKNISPILTKEHREYIFNTRFNGPVT